MNISEEYYNARDRMQIISIVRSDLNRDGTTRCARQVHRVTPGVFDECIITGSAVSVKSFERETNDDGRNRLRKINVKQSPGIPY